MSEQTIPTLNYWAIEYYTNYHHPKDLDFFMSESCYFDIELYGEIWDSWCNPEAISFNHFFTTNNGQPLTLLTKRNPCWIAFKPNGGVTFIVEDELSLYPDEFKLFQNYPNPFNPSTTIKFSISTSPLNPSPYQGEGQRERLVTLKVYDSLGNEIATLVDEEKIAGNYEVKFDGENLSSGIYFYRMQTGDYTDTKKLILMK